MDVLNFISWIRKGRYFTSVNPATTLLPIGLKDVKRDDSYLTGAMTVESLINQIKPYKVYTALLYQNGGDAPSPVYWDETLIKGVTYEIISLAPGDDVTQYGAPNNNIGTMFVCNQNAYLWGNAGSELKNNTGAPVVTVLENTIGNVYWTVVTDGIYVGIVDENTIEQKQVVFTPTQARSTSSSSTFLKVDNNSIDGEVTITSTNGTINTHSLISDFPIEIRVYN
jgi:hypothetical protein